MMNSGAMISKLCFGFLLIIFLCTALCLPCWGSDAGQKLMDLGVEYYAGGSYEKAARAFKECSIRYKSSSALLNLGILYDKELHFFTKAMHYYNQFLAREPKAAEAHLVKKRIKLLTRKRLEEQQQKLEPEGENAEKEDNKPLVVPPKTSGDRHILAGNEYIEKQDYLNAIIAYRKAILLDNNSDAYFALGALYYDYLRFYDKALFFLKRYRVVGSNKTFLKKAEAIINKLRAVGSGQHVIKKTLLLDLRTRL